MTDAPPDFEAIDHLHLFVTDRAAAVAWYRRVLNLHPVAALAAWATAQGPLTLADAAHRLHLALFERPPQPSRATLALRVGSLAQLQAWQQHLAQQLGQAPACVDHGLAQSLYFSDPDGNPFEITCYTAPPAGLA